MLTETPTTDSSEVIDVLSTLIEYARDGQEGFKHAAEHANSPELREFFMDCSNQRAQFVTELQSLQSLQGEDSPDNDGSMTGALHRAWIDIRSVVTQRDDQATLEEAERGEDAAVSAYREALEEADPPLPENVASVIRSQAALVKQTHDRVRELRDSGRFATLEPVRD